jgi:hypothetical protein
MKVALSVITATVVPFGFVALAIAGIGYVLAKRRQAGTRAVSPVIGARQSTSRAA